MKRQSRAFTLLEMLVALALIGVLASLVLVSLKSVRAATGRTESINGLRKMMRGYVSYSTDHRQKLMPGFVDPAVFADWATQGHGLQAELASGDEIQDVALKAGYVWRLAPYIDQQWQTFYTDYGSKSVTNELEQLLDTDDLTIGAFPAYGLNSIFVGGDSAHGGAAVANSHPWQTVNPVIAATNVSVVKNPARLVVFGSTKYLDAVDCDSPPPPGAPNIADVVWGNVELRPPFTGIDDQNVGVGPQWVIHASGDMCPGQVWPAAGAPADAFPAGVPAGRWGEDNIPVGHLDGSTEVINRYELATDMTRWSPFATGIR